MRLNRANRQRLTESVESALQLGGGGLAIESFEAPKSDFNYTEGSKAMHTEKGTTTPYSEEFACPCPRSLPSRNEPSNIFIQQPTWALALIAKASAFNVDSATISVSMNMQRWTKDVCIHSGNQ